MIKSKKVPLSQFITLQRGYDLTKTNMNGGNYPVVGSTSIIGYHDSYKVDSPGVVTGRSGSLGTVQFLNTKFWPHNTSLWVKDFKGNDPSFVYYSLKNLPLADFNAGAGVPTLNRNHLDQLMVTHFPVEYQKKVSLILRQFDDLIENNNRRVEILEEIAQRLYEEWFVHFKFPDHEKVKMIDSELGKIPEGWKGISLRELTEFTIGGGWGSEEEKKDTELVNVIRGTDFIDILRGNTLRIPIRYEKNSKLTKRKIIANDIVLENSINGKTRNAGTPLLINHNLLQESENNFICASFCRLIRLKNPSLSTLVYYSLLNSYKLGLTKKFQVVAANGIANLQSNDLLDKYKVLVPKDLELVTIFDNIFEKISILSRKNRLLAETRDLLLPRLISGEIVV